MALNLNGSQKVKTDSCRSKPSKKGISITMGKKVDSLQEIEKNEIKQ